MCFSFQANDSSRYVKILLAAEPYHNVWFNDIVITIKSNVLLKSIISELSVVGNYKQSCTKGF